MKSFNLISLILLHFCVIGQSNFFKIKNISKDDSFSFPLFSGENNYVLNKINIHLQLSELDLLVGAEKKDIFEIVSFDYGTIYGGKKSMVYDVLANNSKNLSLRFWQSSCGATCYYWVKYYNYNTQNGDLYVLNDFFAPLNWYNFKRYVDVKRIENTKKKLTELKRLGVNIKPFLWIYESIKNDDLTDFYFDNDSIYFDDENLFSKNDKFDGLQNITGIAIKDIKQWLNEFGNSALLTGKELKTFVSSFEPQLYNGSIGNQYEFFMLFRSSYSNEFIGNYAYKKHGKGIQLRGEIIDSTFHFKEKNNDFQDVATIIFQKIESSLTGYWQDNNGKKLKFSASRM